MANVCRDDGTRGDRSSRRESVPGVHAGVRARICLHVQRRPAHRDASACDAARTCSARLGRDRWCSDGHLPCGNARRLALVGRTPIKPFDPARAQPFLLKAGDTVQFYPITRRSTTHGPRRSPARHAHDRAGPRSVGIPVASGVPVAGPMDLVSHRLVERSGWQRAPTRRRSKSRCSVPSSNSRTNAWSLLLERHFSLTVDGRPVSAFATARARSGARPAPACGLARVTAVRAPTLPIAGGIDVPLVLGSRATHVISAMGGFEGRPLRPGDRIPLGSLSSRAGGPLERAATPVFALPDREATVRVLPGRS